MNAHHTQLLQQWQQEEQAPFAGWDFSYLAGRMYQEQPPWDYLARAAELLRNAASVVDLNTGGGERLLDLQPAWPPRVVATEEWPPNFALINERLTPLGVQVYNVRLTDDDPMPFADGEFEVVLNRHAAFNPAEVARVLAPGGTFLTQQVHGLSGQALQAVFGAKPQWPDATPAKYLPRLQQAGLTIVNGQEWSGRLNFTDVGAIVYYLKATPWLVPDFTVDRYTAELLELQARLASGQALDFAGRLYLIEARKPKKLTIDN